MEDPEVSLIGADVLEMNNKEVKGKLLKLAGKLSSVGVLKIV